MTAFCNRSAPKRADSWAIMGGELRQKINRGGDVIHHISLNLLMGVIRWQLVPVQDDADLIGPAGEQLLVDSWRIQWGDTACDQVFYNHPALHQVVIEELRHLVLGPGGVFGWMLGAHRAVDPEDGERVADDS